jgi:ATP-dependent DNA ligase
MAKAKQSDQLFRIIAALNNQCRRSATACDAMQLEGIVSKRRDGRYRSGTRSGWIKVKAASWPEANRERGKLFERQA